MKRITGWGRYPVGHSEVKPLLSVEKFPEGVGIPRGLGRSYGDASFCSEGYTWETSPLNRFLTWDPDTGLLVAEAGVSIYAVIQRFLPEGWFPPVVPGTQFVTLGGAFASNIHGKNHHVNGAFADHVAWIDLLLPSGEVRRLDPSDPLFWATAGGMGLTGIILRLALRLQRVPSAYIANLVYRPADWETLLSVLLEEEMKYPLTVAWVDHTDRRGGGVVHLGRFAEVEELPPAWRKHPFRTSPVKPWRVFSWLTVPAFGRLTAPLISKVYRLRHTPGQKLLPYAPYFFPLDRVGEWNRLWGPRGFVQFQFVVPTQTGLERIWRRLQKAPARSFLTVLKRLGAQRGPLAFSGPGWTLAIDLPATEAVFRFLRSLTDLVLAEGGRIYLTKDSLLHPEQFRAAYPEWEAFLQIKASVDPHYRLRSDLSQRLGLQP